MFAAVPIGCAAHVDVPELRSPTEAWAGTDQSTLPERMQLYVPPGTPPLSSQTCPFQGAPVPVCHLLDPESVTLDKLNGTIRVRGTLATTPIGCRQRNCPSDAPVSGANPKGTRARDRPTLPRLASSPCSSRRRGAPG